jgi:hypothetical protein
MTFRRFAVSLVPVCALFACSNEDAIISLNVTAGADVPVVDQLHVTITQGSRQVVHDFKPPTEAGMGDAGPSIQDSFFERITLPESFTDQDAVVRVEARKAGGAAFTPPLTDETTVRIEEDGVVAAYVKLELPAVVPPPEGGAAGEGGAGGDGGAGAEGGTAGARAEGGTGPAEAGAAGADAAGAGG